jgi:hypothetical protein
MHTLFVFSLLVILGVPTIAFAIGTLLKPPGPWL